MTEKLKPCPFCGSVESSLFMLGDSQKQVVCSINAAGCGASSGWHDKKKRAIAAWNTRADQSAIDAAVKAAVLAERDACAIIGARAAERREDGTPRRYADGQVVADAIRARLTDD